MPGAFTRRELRSWEGGPGPSSAGAAALVSDEGCFYTRHPGRGSGSGPRVVAGAGGDEVREDAVPLSLSPAGSERHGRFCKIP